MDFWNVLSKPAIEKQTLRTRLYAKTGPILPPKLSAAGNQAVSGDKGKKFLPK